MPKIIIANNIKALRKAISQTAQPLIFNVGLSIPKETINKTGLPIIEYRNNDFKSEFDRQFIDFIATLSNEYHSKYWWANSLSEKNEFISLFYSRLFKTVAILRFIGQYSEKDIIILVDDIEVTLQLKQAIISHHSLLVPRLYYYSIKKLVLNLFRLVIKSSIILFRELGQKLFSHYYLNSTVKKLKCLKKCFVVRTVIDKRSYRKNGYSDSYFGKLIGYLQQKESTVLIFAEIVQDYRNNVRKILKDDTYNIIPTNIFLTVQDIVSTVTEGIQAKVRLNKAVYFGDINVTYLVRQELDESFYKTRSTENLLFYLKAKRLCENIDISTYLTIYENHAWEKLTVQALREMSPGLKIFGFQHCFVTANSFKFLPGKDEVGIMPLPDKIITLGRATKKILTTQGHYQGIEIAEGCALRQETIMTIKNLGYSSLKDILVPLAQTKEDAIKVIQFVYDSELHNSVNKIYFRFHPFTPKKKVFSRLKFKWPRNFIISEAASLQDDFKRSGIVLYTWTTVCIEALLYGLPAIYLDINYPLNLDPLFEINYLKRSVSSPGELSAAITELLSIKQQDYEREHSQAINYIKEYFYPVNEENMQPFIS